MNSKKSQNNRVLLTIFLLISILLIKNSFADIIFLDVNAKGKDKNYEMAVNKALKEAIIKINGISLETNDLTRTIEAEIFAQGSLNIDDQKKNGQFIGDAQYKEIQKIVLEKSRGSIKSFEIINEYKDTNNYYNIEILAKVAKFELSQESKRLRLAIIPFRLNPRNFIINLESLSLKQNEIKELLDNVLTAEDLKDYLSNDFTNYFVQTRKFTILDRKFDKEITQELNSIENSSNIVDQVKIGQKISADYILVGEIYSFSIIEKEKKFLTSDLTVKKNVGSFSINYRIINVPTGQIIYSSTYDAEENLKKISKPINYLSNKVVKNIGDKIILEIFPIRVENVDNNLLYLNQGGDNIKVGDKFELYEKTDINITDSYTGEILGTIENKIADIEIIDSKSRYSIGKIIDNKINFAEKFKPLKFIVKPIEKVEVQGKEKKKKKQDLEKVF